MKVSRVCSRVEIAPHEAPLNPGDVVLACHLRGERKTKPAEASSSREKQNESQRGAQGSSSGASQDMSSRDASSQDTSVFLEVAPDTGELIRVLVIDKGGVNLEFRFANWQFDPVIAESAFEFHPPEGVAILNGELPAQNETMK
jgi:hypothetical protein